MLTIEEYAELCARLAGTQGDEATEIAVAAGYNIGPSQWRDAKAHYTKMMSDPTDLGGTALAFIAAFQSARAREEPCSLEAYTRVLAELAHGPARRYADTLEAHGFTRATWRVAEQYWSPRIAAEDDPRFSPGQATRFRVLMAQVTGRNEIAREVDFARSRAG